MYLYKSNIIKGAGIMKGKISKLFKDSGFIKCPQIKSGYYFSKDSLIGIDFDDLLEGMSVEFMEDLSKETLQAKYIRKAPYEYLQGTIIDTTKVSHWNNEKVWTITTERGRNFWFVEKCILSPESAKDFVVGDTVYFQCDGYYSNSNEATMVTKKILGYVTFCDLNKGYAFVDFKYKINLDSRLKRSLSESSSFFYLVSYEKDELYEKAFNLSIIDKTTELLFDGAEKWLSGIIERKGTSINGDKYAIISTDDSTRMTFKIDASCMRKYCDIEYLEEGAFVAFALDESSKPYDVTWSGYITRFPVSHSQKDLSGRINTRIKRDEPEIPSSDLLYFWKPKVNNLQMNTDCTSFWIEPLVFGDLKQIVIKTANTGFRYKVIYSLQDDAIYGKKAVSIRILGINKVSVSNELNNDLELEEIKPSQQTINYNYYGNVTQQINILNISNLNDFVALANTQQLGQYIVETYTEWINESKNKSITDTSSEYFSDLLIEKILPTNQIIASDTVDSLEAKFQEARHIRQDISDMLLAQMSEKCRLYIKIAVIVEYSLNHFKDIPSVDFSAQLVMYGKALEQSLRDNLYDFIIHDSELATYEDAQRKVFISTKRDSTMIGQYSYILKMKCQRFAQITYALQNNILKENKEFEDWKEWWTSLQSKIYNAGDMRNKSDHAGTHVSDDIVVKMGELLFADEGIFSSLHLINHLYNTSKPVLNNDTLIFIGHHTKGNVIVGKLQSGEQAALHIREIREGFVNQEEFQDFYSKTLDGIPVKVLKETSQGLQVSAKL